LRPLERQAQAAERHGQIIGEVTALRTFVAGREITALRRTLEGLATTRVEANAEETTLKASLARLDASIIALEAELTAHGGSDVADRLRRVEQLRERARGIALVLAERRRSIERDRGQLLDAGVVATLEAEVAAARDALGAVGAEVDAQEPELAALLADEAQLERDRGEFSASARPDSSDADGDGLPDERALPARAASAAAEVRGELRSARAALQRFNSELQRTDERARATADVLATARSTAASMRDELDVAAADEATLVGEMEAAEAALRDAAAAMASAQSDHAALTDELARLTARAEALQLALDTARARAGAERLADVDGVLGTLLDLVQIDDGWEAAVEAALGESLSAVVVADPDVARRALGTLRGGATHGAVLALGVRAARPVRPSAGDLVRPHVRSGRPGVSDLLDALLGAAVRIDDVDRALDTALDHPDVVVVTGSGDRFGLAGWRLGVAGGGATAAALAEARDGRDTVAGRVERSAARVRETSAAHDAATRAVADAAQRLDAHDARFGAATEGLSRAVGQQRELQAELDALAVARQEIHESIERETVQIETLAALLPALEGDEVAEADAARERERRRRELEARSSLLAARRRDLDVRLAALAERRASLTARIDDIEHRLDADQAARRAAEGRRAGLERALARLDELLAGVALHVEALDAHHRELTIARQAHADVVRATTDQLDADRRHRHDAERRLDLVRERSRRAELDEAEAKLRLESSVEMLRRELDVEPAVAEAAPLPELPEGATPDGRLRELDRELKLLGPINALALEEFAELRSRNEFLETQLDDVRSTRRELGRVISAIDAEIQQVFAAAYADVSANFTELFEMLFPGGRGRLTLTAPDDLLNTGIEVEAKPSGKNVRKLSLLSGGERSLTALAYLFAVFRSRPSPFYVMDEVEAALDDVNLHRFLQLVGEFRKDAQLLVVSHQKRTMEAGDSLLGVSMQPGGSSRVVTERVSSTV
jgi:chromosome segregation protein